MRIGLILNKGIYCLTIKLVKKHTIRVGCLGTFGFPGGFYVYAGSAQNNLKGRIERHLTKNKKMHWHVDYLLHYGQVSCVHTYAAEKNAECVLSQKIGNIKDAVMPVRGFGSSDCACASHLYFFQKNPESRISRLKINGISPPPLTPPTRGGGNPSSTQIGETFPPP
ncbi:MAG: GIY-YIG nuclease family protein [Planctomycetes bacterium]|nr:GIY-YIG nuclease family protein [Planctomycetota bacterium]